MEYRKYEMSEIVWDGLKKTIQQETQPNEYVFTGCTVHELGYICNQYETIFQNNDWETICVNQSTKYGVDIIWDDNELDTFTQYEVWPKPVGVHIFQGWEEYYIDEYNKRHPDDMVK